MKSANLLFYISQVDLNYLFQGCNKCWGLRFCQLEQFSVEGHGDEALKGQPEVMGVSAQPLHKLPAQSHCLHTEGLLRQRQLESKHQTRNFIRHYLSFAIFLILQLQRTYIPKHPFLLLEFDLKLLKFDSLVEAQSP